MMNLRTGNEPANEERGRVPPRGNRARTARHGVPAGAAPERTGHPPPWVLLEREEGQPRVSASHAHTAAPCRWKPAVRTEPTVPNMTVTLATNVRWSDRYSHRGTGPVARHKGRDRRRNKRVIGR